VEGSGYLPPEPPGPEPEFGGKPRAPEPDPGQAATPPAGGWQQQQPPQQAPYHVPPPGQPHVPPPYQPPAPGQPYAPPTPPPPGQAYPPGYAPYAYGYAPGPPVPDNGPAVAGFVLSLVSGALLLLSAGLSSVVSLGCAVAGMIYSRKGKQKVDAGETPKNRGLAQAGWVIGIICLVLSILATAGWILLLVLALTDDEVNNDFNNDFNDSQGIRSALTITAVLLRLIG